MLPSWPSKTYTIFGYVFRVDVTIGLRNLVTLFRKSDRFRPRLAPSLGNWPLVAKKATSDVSSVWQRTSSIHSTPRQ